MHIQNILLLVIMIVISLYLLYLNLCVNNKEGFVSNATSELPNKIINLSDKNKNSYGEMDILDDDNNKIIGFNYNMCSKSCCTSQYPTPFKLLNDPLLCSSNKEFIPSSYTCNNGWQDSGCLCLTKE